MVLSSVIKKASSLFLQKPQSKSLDLYSEDEIIFSKNNVCVHSNTTFIHTTTHHPGYLTLSYKYKKWKMKNGNIFTLHLVWIPNSILRNNKNTEITKKTALILRKSQSSNDLNYPTDDKMMPELYEHEFANEENHQSSCDQSSSSSTCSEEWILFDCNKFTADKNSKFDDQSNVCESNVKSKSCLSYDATDSLENRPRDKTDFHTCDNINMAETVVNKTEERFFDKKRKLINHYRVSFTEEDIECDKLDNINHTNRKTKEINTAVKKFSVDLSEMKSIRVFFSESDQRNGQLVIMSKENKYKILHFHYGGLDKLVDALQLWGSSICVPVFIRSEEVLSYKHFDIQSCADKSKLKSQEKCQPVSKDMWNSSLNKLGQIEDETTLRKAIFLGGVDKNIRKTVWPFLLNCYAFDSTFEERDQMRIINIQKYEMINKIKNDILDAREDDFLKNLEYLIYKDVIRTDRANSFYMGDDNPNLKIMQNILLNYAVLYNDYGYSQGMSDLLAPILVEIQDEVETFWCFVGLMKRCLFICTPNDSDMEKHLNYLRELIRIMDPTFYSYLETQTDGMDLLFCHRWLLLCFKREFPLDVTLFIWEACWSNYLTRHFHLFISLAIIVTYSKDIMDKNLQSDEILFYFNSLTMRMNGEQIIQEARNLYHSFKSLPDIPPSLCVLCQSSLSDIWDNTNVLSSKTT